VVLNTTDGSGELERLLLTPAETAETIGIGRTRIYELLASGELPSVRIGRSIRIPIDCLRTWIDRQTSPKTRSDDSTMLGLGGTITRMEVVD